MAKFYFFRNRFSHSITC